MLVGEKISVVFANLSGAFFANYLTTQSSGSVLNDGQKMIE